MIFNYEWLLSVINTVYQFFYRLGAWATCPYNVFLNGSIEIHLPALFNYEWSTFRIGFNYLIDKLDSVGGFFNYFGSGVISAVRDFVNIILYPVSDMLGLGNMPFVIVLIIAIFLYGGLIIMVKKFFKIFTIWPYY